jgi:NitT/TauT family transport system permease protein
VACSIPKRKRADAAMVTRLLKRWAPEATGIATLAGALALVEILIRIDVLNRFVMPPPSAVFASFERVLREERIPSRFLTTAAEALGAGVSVAIIGISLGVLLSHTRVLRAATESWIAAFAAAPLVLAYPLFLVVFGRSAVTIAALGFFAALAPVILKTVEGLLGVRRVLVDVGRSFNLTPRQLFWKVEFPAAVPAIFTGLRLGLILALINVVGLEFLINFGGLGQLINDLAERYDLPGVYASICFVVLVSVMFFAALERIERWLRPGS